MPKVVVGVVGPGSGASGDDCALAHELGALVAREGWALLTGGRAEGVMDAASRGAKAAGGLTVGVLPGETLAGVSAAVDVALVTGLGSGRNNVNVLSSRVVFACGMGPGTASEVALAIKADRPVVLVRPDPVSRAFFKSLGGALVRDAETPEEAVALARRLISPQRG
jgi:uncharacterized protein (TIGR00725 family)